MNSYQKMAFVFLRTSAYLTLLYGLRAFAAVAIYVPARYFSILPYFYMNIGYDVFWGCLSIAMGFLVLSISKPLAIIVGQNLEDS